MADQGGWAHDGNKGTEEEEDDQEQVDIHPTFRAEAAMPGQVKVVVNKHEFWCHREVLYFASSFFQGLLQGGHVHLNAQSMGMGTGRGVTDEPDGPKLQGRRV